VLSKQPGWSEGAASFTCNPKDLHNRYDELTIVGKRLAPLHGQKTEIGLYLQRASVTRLEHDERCPAESKIVPLLGIGRTASPGLRSGETQLRDCHPANQTTAYPLASEVFGTNTLPCLWLGEHSKERVRRGSQLLAGENLRQDWCGFNMPAPRFTAASSRTYRL
jgi:hypothetical protein